MSAQSAPFFLDQPTIFRLNKNYSLKTEKILERHKFLPYLMTRDVIERVLKLGKKGLEDLVYKKKQGEFFEK